MGSSDNTKTSFHVTTSDSSNVNDGVFAMEEDPPVQGAFNGQTPSRTPTQNFNISDSCGSGSWQQCSPSPLAITSGRSSTVNQGGPAVDHRGVIMVPGQALYGMPMAMGASLPGTTFADAQPLAILGTDRGRPPAPSGTETPVSETMPTRKGSLSRAPSVSSVKSGKSKTSIKTSSSMRSEALRKQVENLNRENSRMAQKLREKDNELDDRAQLIQKYANQDLLKSQQVNVLAQAERDASKA